MTLTLLGQMCSGKNAVLVTRTGHRYPGERFETWKQDAVFQLRKQLRGVKGLPITEPVSVSIKYTAGDRKRRDAPGVIDALWHVLEYVGVVEDDKLLGGEGKTIMWEFLEVDKKHPKVEIIIN